MPQFELPLSLLSCQPELVEGGFRIKRAFPIMHRLRQAQTDNFSNRNTTKKLRNKNFDYYAEGLNN